MLHGPVPATSQQLANHLETGFWQETGSAPHRFALGTDRALSVNITALDAAGQKLARQAMKAWESVADIKFVETTGAAKIRFDDHIEHANASYTYLNGITQSAEVVIGAGWTAKYGSQVGGYGLQTYLHKIGHALGLGHSGAYNGGEPTYADAKFTIDSWQKSMMSYLDQDENTTIPALKAFVATPMQADILAIQSLYGRTSGGVTAGATTYGVGANTGTPLDRFFGHLEGSLRANAITVYDEAGIDTFNFSDDTAAQRINLGDGAFSTVYGRLDNLAIAHGTVIENAIGGAGADQITGNGAANTLNGKAGNDTISGAGGADTLQGADGADRLTGGGGADTLVGGAGTDSFVFDGGNDRINDFANNADTLVINRAIWGGASKTINQVLAMGHLEGNDVVLDLAAGHQVRLLNLGSVKALSDDLAFI